MSVKQRNSSNVCYKKEIKKVKTPNKLVFSWRFGEGDIWLVFGLFCFYFANKSIVTSAVDRKSVV